MPYREDSKFRILIVDDDEDDFFIISGYINKVHGPQFEIDWCYNYADARDKIEKHDYSLYLIDYHLGAKTGLDLIKDAVSNGWEQPFILLTGKGNHQIDLEAMKSGAMDYLIKGELDTEKLGRSIRYAIERDKSIRALRANEKKYRSIFELSTDAIFLADNNLFFKDLNPATEILFDQPREELMQKSFLNFLTADDREKLIAELTEKNGVVNREVLLTTASGEKKYCLFSASEEETIEGEYYQGIAHDITELKKAEKANLRMEKRGMADRLVHVLAHEVRNPLNNINLSLEQLSPEIAESESKIFVDIIQRNSKRIESLITELLNSSRPAQIIEEPESLQDIIQDTLSMAIDRITLKKIDLKLSLPEDGITVLADREKLKIAVLNVIINAVEAMEAGKGELQVKLYLDKNLPVISIKDNGCGISEENISKLFEPYFTAKRNGMGLGLATSLNILQSHKADVEVLSTESVGTEFLIRFNQRVSDSLLNKAEVSG